MRTVHLRSVYSSLCNRSLPLHSSSFVLNSIFHLRWMTRLHICLLLSFVGQQRNTKSHESCWNSVKVKMRTLLFLVGCPSCVCHLGHRLLYCCGAQSGQRGRSRWVLLVQPHQYISLCIWEYQNVILITHCMLRVMHVIPQGQSIWFPLPESHGVNLLGIATRCKGHTHQQIMNGCTHPSRLTLRKGWPLLKTY